MDVRLGQRGAGGSSPPRPPRKARRPRAPLLEEGKAKGLLRHDDADADAAPAALLNRKRIQQSIPMLQLLLLKT